MFCIVIQLNENGQTDLSGWQTKEIWRPAASVGEKIYYNGSFWKVLNVSSVSKEPPRLNSKEQW